MEKHNRRSIRLPGYDYSQPGSYYVTICTFRHQLLFGRIEDGHMILNEFGKIAEIEWLRTANMRSNIELNGYILMPNHLHGIIHIVQKKISTSHSVGAHCNVPLPMSPQIEGFGKSTKNTIPTMVKLFKSTVTKRINQIRKTPELHIWQRGYYKHIISESNIYNNPRILT